MKNRLRIASSAMPRVFLWLCFVFLVLFLAIHAIAQSKPDNMAAKDSHEVPDANPARPTVATPATLTPVGYLQFENGLLYAADSSSFSSRLAFEQTTKLTVHPRLQFLVTSEPVVHSGLGPVKEFNPGDVLVGAQGVVLAGRENRPTVAFSYFKHAYQGSAPDLDIGTPEHSLLLLISDDLAGFHFDLNGFFNEQLENQVGRAQFGQTISVSHALKKFTIAGELWHFTQPFQQGNAVGNLWAISYPVRRNLVVDAGFNRGLTSTSSQWAGFAGFTYLLPHRIWPAGNHAGAAK
ncbi:MAG TPA: hypothetical protein VKH81_06630 [Candidatus Angelobacter sp.]|nr:hypothetical protein [Candidatus Angelobacter sp.]